MAGGVGMRFFKGQNSRFRGRGYSQNQQAKGTTGGGDRSSSAVRTDEATIGSELSSRDQFDIFIPESRAAAVMGRHRCGSRPVGNGTTGDTPSDASTISSITTDDKRGYFFRSDFNHSRMNAGIERTESNTFATSWCCYCGPTVGPAEPKYENDNTMLVESTKAADTHKNSNTSSTFCCVTSSASSKAAAAATAAATAEGYVPATPREQHFHWASRASTEISRAPTSLFDTLSDIDYDTRDETEQGIQRKKSWRPSLRRALPWRRKQTLSKQEVSYMQDSINNP